MDYEYTSPNVGRSGCVIPLLSTCGALIVSMGVSVVGLGFLSGKMEERDQKRVFDNQEITLVSLEKNKEGKIIGHFDFDGNPETVEQKSELLVKEMKSENKYYLSDETFIEAVRKDNVGVKRKVCEWNNMFQLKLQAQHTNAQ